MTTHKQFTLAGVVEIVRGHAEALSGIAQAVHDVGNHQPGDPAIDEGILTVILELAGQRARAAAEDLWEISGRAPKDGDKALEAVWDGEPLDEKMGLAQDTLPILFLAAEAAALDPLGGLEAGLNWNWVHWEAGRIAQDLHAWVEAQEKEEVQ